MYKGERADVIVSKHQPDPDYVYFDLPDKIRVHKTTGQIQFFKSQKWQPAKQHVSVPPNNPRKVPQYWRITRTKPEGTRSWSSARLIAIACIPNPDNYTRVTHIDGNTLNDAPSNLAWIDDTKGFWLHRTNKVLDDDARKELATACPGAHHGKNKAFMKVYNKMKDANGLTHSRRFATKFREKGYRYCLDKSTGKYGWQKIDDLTFHTTQELKELFK